MSKPPSSRSTRIAGVVPAGVVERLEVIDVQHDDADGAPAARGAGELEVERLLHVAAVEEPRERVQDGLASQGVAQPQVGERQRDALSHGHRELLLGLAQRLGNAIALTRLGGAPCKCRRPIDSPCAIMGTQR